MWFQLLRTEDLDCPLALGTANPRLSWVLASDERDARQAAYEIRAASSAVLLKQDRPDLWHTGRVDAPSQRIAYAGAPLRSRQRVYWQVRIWPGTSPRSMSHGPRSSPVDVTSTEVVTSPVRWFETGLLGAADWGGRWVTHPAWVADGPVAGEPAVAGGPGGGGRPGRPGRG